jgi:DNA-binding transcriptional regulator LsrR (DeoR family)
MTGVETIARIRFEHFQNGKGIKRIARELGIARDTVRKVLRSGVTEFVYKRTVQPQRTRIWLFFSTDSTHDALCDGQL